MKSYLDCIPCFVRQSLDACRMITNNEDKIKLMLSQILSQLSKSNLELPPPVIVADLHRIIRKELESEDPYRQLKIRSTQKGLELAPAAIKMIDGSENPFATALRFAIAGNILDFGAKTNWDEERVATSFRSALTKEILNDKTRALFQKITDAESVLYGTYLPKTSEAFQKLFRTADVVISKGQGNFETLNDEEREIFFLFQIKCESLGKRNGYAVGDWVISD